MRAEIKASRNNKDVENKNKSQKLDKELLEVLSDKK